MPATARLTQTPCSTVQTSVKKIIISSIIEHVQQPGSTPPDNVPALMTILRSTAQEQLSLVQHGTSESELQAALGFGRWVRLPTLLLGEARNAFKLAQYEVQKERKRVLRRAQMGIDSAGLTPDEIKHEMEQLGDNRSLSPPPQATVNPLRPFSAGASMSSPPLPNVLEIKQASTTVSRPRSPPLPNLLEIKQALEEEHNGAKYDSISGRSRLALGRSGGQPSQRGGQASQRGSQGSQRGGQASQRGGQATERTGRRAGLVTRKRQSQQLSAGQPSERLRTLRNEAYRIRDKLATANDEQRRRLMAASRGRVEKYNDTRLAQELALGQKASRLMFERSDAARQAATRHTVIQDSLVPAPPPPTRWSPALGAIEEPDGVISESEEDGESELDSHALQSDSDRRHGRGPRKRYVSSAEAPRDLPTGNGAIGSQSCPSLPMSRTFITSPVSASRLQAFQVPAYMNRGEPVPVMRPLRVDVKSSTKPQVAARARSESTVHTPASTDRAARRTVTAHEAAAALLHSRGRDARE